MAGFTTAFPTSEKQELAQAMHCFTSDLTATGATVSGSYRVTSLSSVANLCAGMPISATGIPANSYVAYFDSTSSFYFGSATSAATAAGSGVTITFKGDAYACALGIASPTGTYGAATTNYSNLTGNSDEVANGSGYTTGGFTWTSAQNVTPQTSGTTAFWQWSVNPSWTSASFSTSGCLIYQNTAARSGASGRAAYVGSFGGTQTVTSGTLTLTLPTNNSSTALLRIS